MTLRRACVALGTVALLAGCGGEEAPPEKIVRPIVHAEVERVGGATNRTFSGTAETDKVINLSFRASGIITKLDARIGQRVTAGHQIGELDNVSSRLSYEQAVSSMNSASSQLNTAKLALERARSLYEKGSASLSEFEAAKNSFKTAESSYESAQRSVDLQREQVRYGYIYAPEDGVISSVFAELDENVSAGQAIAVLSAGTDKEIALGLPESVINRVREGMRVDVTFPALVDRTFEGEVTEVSPSVDPGTSTYPIRIALLEAEDTIRAGMAADVSFAFGDTNGGGFPVVPAKAVREDGEGHFVFRVERGEPNSVVRKHRVRIGEMTTSGFEIEDGLEGGEVIATAGLQTLLDGQEVRLLSE